MTIWIVITGLAGLGLGMLIQHLLGRARQVKLESEIALRDAQLISEEARAAERETALQSARDSLAASFNELAQKSLEKNSENFLRLANQKLDVHQEKARAELSERQKAVETLVQPIKEALEKAHKQIGEIEKTRQEAYGNITSQLTSMTRGQESLRSETSKLVSALRRPQVRGQWGEMTLRRLAELAGMVHHCDFSEQVHTTDDDNRGYRPDMIIRLPEEGQLVVDVKTPLDAYLDATEANDEQTRKDALKRHASNVKARVRELSSKDYYKQFDKSPEFVILFVPGDQFLTAALDEDPDLLEKAMSNKVLLSTPTSLIALLKVVAYGWMQLKLAENADDIRKLAVEMQDRIGVFTNHLGTVGKRLDDSVKSYNKAIASLESRVLPTARRIRELGAEGGKEVESPQSVDISAREIKLVADADQTDSTGNDDASADNTDQPTP
jgi:DNA recombination protein RmuC